MERYRPAAWHIQRLASVADLLGFAGLGAAVVPIRGS